jgi:2-C-methyl-D-erythritol 4-phosphate cytidylyltransferase
LRITDESAAIEALDFKPRLIPGRSDNLKITLPQDLLLAAAVLHSTQPDIP